MLNPDELRRRGISLDLFDIGQERFYKSDSGGLHTDSDCAYENSSEAGITGITVTVRDVIENLCSLCWKDIPFATSDQALVDELNDLIFGENFLADYREDDVNEGILLNRLEACQFIFQSVKGSTPETLAWVTDLHARFRAAEQGHRDILCSDGWRKLLVDFHTQNIGGEWEEFLTAHGCETPEDAQVSTLDAVLQYAARSSIPEALAQVVLDAKSHWLPERPHRPLGDEDLGAYVNEIRKHALLEEAEKFHQDGCARRPRVDADLMVAVVALPARSGNPGTYQSIVPYERARKNTKALIVAPKIVVTGLAETTYSSGSGTKSLVEAKLKCPDPVTLETMVELWDPEHPVFKKLGRLKEAGKLTQ